MNGIDHFKFKRVHRQHRMSVVTQIGNPNLTTNGHGNGHKMQEDRHLSEQLPLGMRLKSYWDKYTLKLSKGWEPVVVNKSVDSVTMPKWVASAILVAVLGFGVSSWWRSSDQRDMLIELRTELRLAKERETEKSTELRNQANLNKVYIDNMTNQLNVIKGMLSQQQQSTIDRLNHGER